MNWPGSSASSLKPALDHNTDELNMDNSEWTGMVIAALVAVLAFGIARFATRHFARRRAAREHAATQANQSRQVRRANERRKK